MTRVCCDCKIEKSIEDFYFANKKKNLRKYYCRDCAKIRNQKNRDYRVEYQKKWYQEHKEEKLEQSNIWKRENRERKIETDRAYRKDHREEMNEYARAYYKENNEKILAQKKALYEKNKEHYRRRARLSRRKRYENDINFRIKANVHRAINKAIVGEKIDIEETVGYNIERLRAHLELQFTEEMNWENYGRGPGTWQIDHIIPQWAYDFCIEEEIKKCWDLRNLRPLNSKENNNKNGTIDFKLVEEHFLHDLLPNVLVVDKE